MMSVYVNPTEQSKNYETYNAKEKIFIAELRALKMEHNESLYTVNI
jgi:hypothetical protein